jgi:hypothetical protein
MESSNEDYVFCDNTPARQFHGTGVSVPNDTRRLMPVCQAVNKAS